MIEKAGVGYVAGPARALTERAGPSAVSGLDWAGGRPGRCATGR